ncbi:MAG: glycosyltransferase, partial [Chlorobi bacterium]|nr:glycosyltransferase [Chlorobiota bacterium]
MSAVIFAITIIGIIAYAIILMFIVVRLLLLFIQDAKPKKAHRNLPPYSVVVPFRNEADNLPALLWGLLRQRHKPERIILVNDNSTDNFQEVLQPFLKAFPFIELINNSGSGKKQALKEGLERAPTQWIAITDADSMPHSEWSYGILAYSQNQGLDLIGGMVVSGGRNFTEVLGTIDLMAQLSLSCVTKHNPVTISASSLFVKKDVWQALMPEWMEVPSVSGDDVFMLYIAQSKGFKTG